MSIYINKPDELTHWGIKGQKWGVRRYQNADGTLTPAGKKRYDDSDGDSSTTKKKSKHRTKLEERYMSEGMNRQDAEKEASKRIKTEKIIAGVSALTIAAATAYLVNKHVKERADQIINKGDKFQRIDSRKTIFGSKDRNLHDSFYVTNNEYDNKNYHDAFGQLRKYHNGKAYKLDITATDEIKIASQKKAKDTFANLLYNDEKFRLSLDPYSLQNDVIKGNSKYKVNDRYINDILEKRPVPDRIMKKMYENYNSALVGKPSDRYESKNRSIFYNSLRKQGYSGVQDINDLKRSRLRGKNPLILFDKSKVTVSKVESIVDKVSRDGMDKAYRRMDILRGSQEIARVLPALAGVSVSTATAYYFGGEKAPKNQKTKIVNEYKKEHPNTKLSDTEILNNYYQ